MIFTIILVYSSYPNMRIYQIILPIEGYTIALMLCFFNTEIFIIFNKYPQVFISNKVQYVNWS